jgi:hypothetical protein
LVYRLFTGISFPGHSTWGQVWVFRGRRYTYIWAAEGQGLKRYQETDFVLDYLQLAVFPELTLGHKVRVHASLGPCMSFLIHSSRKGRITYSSMSPAYYSSTSEVGRDAFQNFKKLDLRFQGNTGISFPLTKKFGMNLDFGFSVGVNNISQSYSFINSWDTNLRLGMAYRLSNFSLPSFLKKL